MTVRFPTTGAIAGDLYGMVLRELTLCKTTSEETVVIFTDTRTNTNYAAGHRGVLPAQGVVGAEGDLYVAIGRRRQNHPRRAAMTSRGTEGTPGR